MKQKNWLLLTHQLPSHPSNVRVKVWRKLQMFGAVPIKNSIYVLPDRPESREDFEWLKKEIAQMKGQASVFLANPLTDMEEREIVQAFRKSRAEEFEELLKEAEAFSLGLKNTLEGGIPSEESYQRLYKQWSGLRSEWERLQKLDFFGAPNRSRVDAGVHAVERLIRRAESMRRKKAPEPPSPIDAATLKGCLWVTRTSPHIDRLASAWLIRRYVDPDARFKFITEPYAARRGEIRFDMSEAEFTHFGDWCTFETFLHRLRLSDAVLEEMSEIIHDIDLKDAKFGRPEAQGVSLGVQGLCRLHERNEDRLAAGIGFFEGLYSALAARKEKKP